LTVLAIGLGCIAAPVCGQEAGGEAIIVTGRGLDASPGTPAYGSVVIDRDRLTGNASGRLEDVLADIAGFQQFRRADSRAANPTTQGATLRALGGNASSRALVLLDGVPQADPFTGFIPWSALPPGRLASARVTRGGGAGPFGAGAVAGTIELASGGPAELSGLAGHLFYGSRDATELAGSLGTRVGAGFVTASASWDRGDGYVLIPRSQRGPIDVPARYDAWSAALRGIVPVGAEGEVQASALLFDDHRRRGLVGGETRSRGADASLHYVGRGAWGLDVLAYVQERGFESGIVAVDDARMTGSLALDQFNTPSIGLGGKVELRPPVGGGHVLRIGGDVRHADGVTNERSRYQAGVATRLRRAGGETLTAGLFIEDDWTLGRLVLTGGARIDRWTISRGFLSEIDLATGAPTQALAFPDRSGWQPSGRVGALYSLDDSLTLRAAGYLGFRVPTLNELYRPFRVGADGTAANAALRLEKLKGIEGGIDFRPAPGAAIGLTAFWNRLDNAIANVTLGQWPGVFPQLGFVAGAFRQRLNVDSIRVRGLEATARAEIGEFRLSASAALSDSRVDASGPAAALDGKRPAQSPKYAAGATLAWAPAKGPFLSASVRYAGARFEDDLQTRRLPDALTVDAGASLPIREGLRLTARAENMFDTLVVSGTSDDGIIDRGTPRTLWIGLVLGD
jgi:iron complex outermembrane receptor protein